MKTIHMHKLNAIMEMKLKALLSKNFIISPIFAIGFTFMMKLVYGSVTEGGLDDMLKGMALSLGALMSVTMTGIYCVSAALAEEKEKHTLRVLMTSSVNGLEFFLGSLLPVVGMILLTNAVIVPVSGLSMQAGQWAVYLGISLLCAVTCAIIGMIFGIFAKNQVTASTITTPALLILMMLPMFANFNKTVAKISEFVFTGVMQQTIIQIAEGNTQIVSRTSVAIMAAEIVAAVLCFLVIYRKNGYDKD